MDLNFDLELVESQKVLLTPQLKQAYEILRMNSQELFEYVEEQLEENPVLEILESDEYTGEISFADKVDRYYGKKDCLFARSLKNSTEDETDNLFGPDSRYAAIGMSLKEHLQLQLHMACLDENKLSVGEYLIDNIDENGYLAISLNEVANYFNISTGKAAKVLEIVQSFDPPGICARNLKECLLIQINQSGNKDKELILLVEKHLDDLASNRISEIAKDTGMTIQRILELVRMVKAMEPKPGRAFYSAEDVKLIISDVIIKKMKDHFEALINEDAVPLVNINEYYRKVLSLDVSSEVKRFIQSKIDSAAWLIKCIEKRKNILNKISEYIICSQKDFLEKGKNYIKPLTASKIADAADVHESIVKTILTGKYLQCMWGVFEMKYFVA